MVKMLIFMMKTGNLKKYLNSIISNFNWMGENIIVYLMGIVFSIIRDNILLNNSDVKLINDTS